MSRKFSRIPAGKSGQVNSHISTTNIQNMSNRAITKKRNSKNVSKDSKTPKKRKGSISSSCKGVRNAKRLKIEISSDKYETPWDKAQKIANLLIGASDKYDRRDILFVNYKRKDCQKSGHEHAKELLEYFARNFTLHYSKTLAPVRKKGYEHYCLIAKEVLRFFRIRKANAKVLMSNLVEDNLYISEFPWGVIKDVNIEQMDIDIEWYKEMERDHFEATIQLPKNEIYYLNNPNWFQDYSIEIRSDSYYVQKALLFDINIWQWADIIPTKEFVESVYEQFSLHCDDDLDIERMREWILSLGNEFTKEYLASLEEYY